MQTKKVLNKEAYCATFTPVDADGGIGIVFEEWDVASAAPSLRYHPDMNTGKLCAHSDACADVLQENISRGNFHIIIRIT